MTFKLTQEQIDTIQEVFDKQSPGQYDFDCWEGINKQLLLADKKYIKITEEGKEVLSIFYLKPQGRGPLCIEMVKVTRD